MPEEVKTYINSQRVCVLAIEKRDHSPHAAAVHYAYDEINNIFYFESYKDAIKVQMLTESGEARASMVIGTDESNMKTLQVDGCVKLVEEGKKKDFENIYLSKFQDKQKKYEENKYVVYYLEPEWWRFTDWTTNDGKKIIGSDILS